MLTWTNWRPGQPNGDISQLCVALNNDTPEPMEDKECDSEYRYLCEQETGKLLFITVSHISISFELSSSKP